jgi:hypothetical protein
LAVEPEVGPSGSFIASESLEAIIETQAFHSGG